MSRRRRRGGSGGTGLDYDIPFTSIWDVRTDLPARFGTPTFLWAAGDGNTPTIGPALTVTGAPTVGTTPWQDPDGTAVPSEVYDTGQSRGTAIGALDTPSGADLYSLIIVQLPKFASTGAGILWGNSNGNKGFFAYINGSGGLRFVVVGNAVAQPTVNLTMGALAVIHCLYALGGNTAVYCAGQSQVLPSPPGDLGPSILRCGFSDATYPIEKGAIIAVAHYHGVGVAAKFDAAARAEIDRLALGYEPAKGAAPTFTRASAASWADSTGRLHIASSGLPRAGGDSGGIRTAPTRTNKFYNTVNPIATTGWSATGGTHSHSVDDSAALATAKLEAAGPYVHRFVPGAGDEVVYGGAATGGTDVHSLSCYLRGAAGGETVVLGLRDASSGAVQVGATLTLTTAWVRYYAQGITPADSDQVGALDCDAGDTVYFTLPQLEAGARATSPIPNWATAAAAVRAAETLDTAWTPSDVAGAVEATITPLGWSDTEAGDSLILDRATGTGELLRADSAGGLCSDDGTTEARDTTTALADGVAVDALVAWGGTLDIEVDGTRTVVAYDGALQGSGVLRLEASLGEVAVRDVRCYRRRR